MKKIIFLFMLMNAFVVFTQNNQTYKTGDEIEYFDGLNWIESKIIQVGSNGKYLVYINRTESETKWYSAEDIQPLYKDDAKIIKTKVEIIETVVQPKYRVEDFVKYKDANQNLVLTTIMNLGPDYTYQIYTDTNKVGAMWIHEKDLIFVSSIYKEEVQADKEQIYTYKVNDVLEFYEDNTWKKGTIQEISSEGKYKFHQSTNWFKAEDIRSLSINPNENRSSLKFKEGDLVKVYDGKNWIESEVIQVGTNQTYQVYYNLEKTSTKWAVAKDLQPIK
jgi:hypothetical protein